MLSLVAYQPGVCLRCAIGQIDVAGRKLDSALQSYSSGWIRTTDLTIMSGAL